MGKRHDEAVKAIGRRYKYRSNTKKVYAHRVKGFPDPPIQVGKEGFIPDVYVKFNNGREKLIEVDTSRPLSGREKRQHEAFKRSAGAKPNVRSYEHVYASDVL